MQSEFKTFSSRVKFFFMIAIVIMGIETGGKDSQET